MVLKGSFAQQSLILQQEHNLVCFSVRQSADAGSLEQADRMSARIWVSCEANIADLPVNPAQCGLEAMDGVATEQCPPDETLPAGHVVRACVFVALVPPGAPFM